MISTSEYNGEKLYEGEWDDELGLKDGQGVQIFVETGELYEGFWQAGKAHGQGRLIHSNGDVYDGEWYEDRAHGFGRSFYFQKVDGETTSEDPSRTCYEG